MDTNLIQEALKNSQLEVKVKEEIYRVGKLKRVSAGEVLIRPGVENKEVPIVIQGVIRIMRHDQDGNEMFLYYLEGGETCAMSITCCLEERLTSFGAVAEEDAILWMIPMNYLDEWVSTYSSFRKFIFNAYQLRFEELLLAIDSMAFMKLDQRLYKFLLDTKQASGSFTINKTHEQIALELNTSRVVISRLLKQLEREDKIEVHRNRIDIL